jgi:hypothetical protein
VLNIVNFIKIKLLVLKELVPFKKIVAFSHSFFIK